MEKMIEYLERKIEMCDSLDGLEKEKWAFIQCLKEAKKQALILPAVVKSLKEKEEITLWDWIKQDARYLGYGMFLYKDKEYTFTELSQIYDSQHQL